MQLAHATLLVLVREIVRKLWCCRFHDLLVPPHLSEGFHAVYVAETPHDVADLLQRITQHAAVSLHPASQLLYQAQAIPSWAAPRQDPPGPMWTGSLVSALHVTCDVMVVTWYPEHVCVAQHVAHCRGMVCRISAHSPTCGETGGKCSCTLGCARAKEGNSPGSQAPRQYGLPGCPLSTLTPPPVITTHASHPYVFIPVGVVA